MINMIAEFKLDGDANDTWGNHAVGTISGATPYASCIQNTCYSFNGVGDSISFSDAQDLRLITGGTISAWIYPKSLGGLSTGRIVDKSTADGAVNGYYFALSSNNRLLYNNAGGAILASSNNAVVLNQWQLATVTFNASVKKLYINGVDVTASGGSDTTLPPDAASTFKIGGRTAAQSFDGYIDEVRIYNVVVPISQIKEQYYAGLNNLLANGGITKQKYQNRIEELGTNL